ncbi:hypothetical protein L5515_018523 [Caenorhabditis briggsae]|uniref:CXC domain-containing protein n=1 Tax=Caenorhabditis briggsae TaxID=6238 RepID=A0AAE9FJN2_CAEBR|nr:hypothetical protein L5515_018523 [Caenorhabditis briggsae]
MAPKRKTATTSEELPGKQKRVRQVKRNQDDEVEKEIGFQCFYRSNMPTQDEIHKAVEEVSKMAVEVLKEGKTITNPDLAAVLLAEDKIQPNEEKMEDSDDDSMFEMSMDNYVEDRKFKKKSSRSFFLQSAYENGVHGYRLDEHEHSEQILFEIMKRLIPGTTNADLLYFAIHCVFPNIGTQFEISKMFPKLCRKYASEDSSLVGLERWKAQEQVEDLPVLPQLPEPEVLQHFIVKQMNLKIEKDDERCSDDCYKDLSPGYFEKMLKKLDSRNPSDVLLYVAKSKVTNSKTAAFLNDLLLRSETWITGFCEHARTSKENTCAKWFELLMDNSTIPDDRLYKTTMKKYKDDQKGFNKRLNRFYSAVWTKKDLNVHPLTPCNHVGSCGPNVPHCSCNKYCTVACQCRYDCGIKFPGCNCGEVDGQSCGTSSCPCVLLKLECNPLTCNTCSRTSGNAPCLNAELGKGAMVVIHVKRSGVPQIEGNGAFLGQSVKKHECLGEYVGESIPDEEIERRGAEYHFHAVTFLIPAKVLGQEWMP